MMNRIVEGIVALAILAMGMWTVYHAGEKAADERYQATLQGIRADSAERVATAERHERDKEAQFNSRQAALSADYERRTHENDAKVAAADAAVAAGTLRLRQRFTCQGDGAPSAVRQAASDPAGTAGPVPLPRGFGLEDAGAAVRIADEGSTAARKLNLCIATLKAERQGQQ